MHSFRRHPNQPTAAFHLNPFLPRLIQELLEQRCTAPFDDLAEFVTLSFVVVIGSTDGHCTNLIARVHKPTDFLLLTGQGKFYAR